MNTASLRITTLVFLFLFSLQALALQKPNIQVNAEASIKQMPDFIRIHISIEQTGDDTAAIKTRADRITRQALDAAKKLGIDEQHIEASGFSIQPHYEWHERERRLIGETVRRTVNIKLYDLAKYSALATAMAGLEITRMQQQGFGFDDPEKHQHQALIKALDKAKAKAQVIAKTMGGKLGAVHQVSESPASSPQPMQVRSMAMAEKDEGAPLEIRPQSISATVHVIFLLEH